MTTIEQWQAGGGVPGHPPWDGTGIPFPVGSDGWPVVPGAGGPTTLTLAGVPVPGDIPSGTNVVLTATASQPIPGDKVQVSFNTNGGSWTPGPSPSGPADTLVWNIPVIPGGLPGAVLGYRVADPNDPAVVSNEVYYTIEAPPVLTLEGQGGDVLVGSLSRAYVDATTNQEGPGSAPDLFWRVQADPEEAWTEVPGGMTLYLTPTRHYEGFFDVPAYEAGRDVLEVQARNQVDSNVLLVTILVKPTITLTSTETTITPNGTPVLTAFAAPSPLSDVYLEVDSATTNNVNEGLFTPGAEHDGGRDYTWEGGPIATGEVGSLVYLAAIDAETLAKSSTVTLTVAAALDPDTLSGWTVGELRQFAADHEPPIVIPPGSHKAAIIALILAALAAGTTPTQPTT